MKQAWLLGMFILSSSLSCGPDERAVVEDARSEAIRAFQPIAYRRFRGTGQEEDRLTIAQDGSISCAGRSFGVGSGQLSEFQRMQLVRIFEGWDRLKSEYHGPMGVSDAWSVEITYGSKKVTVSGLASGVPEEFLRARQKLESLPRDLIASQP